MENEVKNSLFNSVLLSICVFVGVGFVTGAEIWFYFARFGYGMFFGLFIFGALCFVLIIFEQRGCSKNKKLDSLHFYVSFASELFIASAMVSGIFETSHLLFGSFWWIVSLVSIACLIFVFIRGVKSQKIYNYFVALFLFFVILALFLLNNEKFGVDLHNLSCDLGFKNAILAGVFAIVYIFTNIGTIRPMIEKFNHQNKKIKKILLAGIISLLLIFLILMFSFFLWLNPDLLQTQMPFLLLFNNCGGVVKFIFLAGLMMCLISTCIGCLEGVFFKFK